MCKFGNIHQGADKIMKEEYKIIGLSILLGLFTGLADSVVDYFMFYDKPFWDLLIFDIPLFEIYVRAIILIVFIISGFIVSKIMAKRRLAEKKISQQNDFLNLVLDSLNHPFLVIDTTSYTISLANSAALTGRLPKGLTCYALTHKRDIPCNSAEDPCPIEIVKKTKKPVTLEHIHYDEDGSMRNVEVHAHPVIDSQGNVSQVIEYSIDVTKRKMAEKDLSESEERFRAITRTAQDGIISINSSGNIVFWNQAASNMFGYAETEMMDKSINQLIPPQYKEAHKEEIERAKTTGEHNVIGKTVELPGLKKDGQEFAMEISLSEWKTTEGVFYTGILRDISERKQAEEQRDRLILDLQKALAEVKTLSGLLPICAHCKSVRDDKGYWEKIEAYIHKHSDTEFSHGICPECAKKYYPDMDLYGDGQTQG